MKTEIYNLLGRYFGKLKGYLSMDVDSKKENEAMGHEDVPQMDEETFRNEFFKALGGEVTGVDENVYYVEYQGGTFGFRFFDENSLVKIYFPYFSSFKCQELHKAHFVANRINCQGLWNVGLRVDTEDEKLYNASCHIFFTPSDSPVRSVEVLKRILPYAFQCTRDFDAGMQECENMPDSELENLKMDVLHKMNYDLRKREVEESEKMCETTDGRLTIANILALSRDVDFGCLEGLRIVAGDEMEKIESVEEILAFDIKEYVVANSHPERFTLLLDFEKESLVLDLKKSDASTDRELFYLMAVARNSNNRCDADSTAEIPFCFKTTIGVRLTTESEDTWEAKYMIEEAKEKNEELYTDEYLSCLDKESVLHYYWGLKNYDNCNFLQALYHMKRVYYSIRHSSDETPDVYYLVCKIVGDIYMRLNMFDTAFHYLSSLPSENVFNDKLFVKCLSRLNGRGGIAYIVELHNNLVNYMNAEEDKENIDPSVMMFFVQVNRTIVEMMIRHSRYAMAKEYLDKLAQIGYEKEYIREMLEKVERLMADEKDGKENGEARDKK